MKIYLKIWFYLSVALFMTIITVAAGHDFVVLLLNLWKL
jgi:hypothetical protein